MRQQMRRLFQWLIPTLGFAMLIMAVGALYPVAAGATEVAFSMGDIGIASIAGLAMGAVVDLPTLYIDANKKVYRPGRNVEIPDADAEKLGLKSKSDAEVKSSTEINNPVGPTGGPEGDEIPDSFPAAEELRKAGFTMADVREATKEDLVAIEGIGDKTADKILAAR